MSCKTAKQVILDSGSWRGGSKFTPCDARRRINAANAGSAISIRRATEVMNELVTEGLAVKVAKNKWQTKNVKPEITFHNWRRRSDAELGITRYLTGGMGWIEVVEI